MTDRCEPPEELRGKDGTHWLSYNNTPAVYAEWLAAEQAWFFPHDQVVAPLDSMSTSWRYIAPALTPAEADALRAENARLREALEVASAVCGKNNCNCPGAPRVRAAVSAALDSKP